MKGLMKQRRVQMSDLVEFYGLFPNPALAQVLLNIVEDFRISEIQANMYPALGKKRKRECEKSLNEKRPSISNLESDLSKGVEALTQKLLVGYTKGEIPGNVSEFLVEAEKLVSILTKDESDVHDSVKIAADVYFLLDDYFGEQSYQESEGITSYLDQDTFEKAVGNFTRTAMKAASKFESSQASDIRSENDIKKLLKYAFDKYGIAPKDIEADLDSGESGHVMSFIENLEKEMNSKDPEEVREFRYHEWDHRISKFKIDYVTVQERKATGDDISFYDDFMKEKSGLITQIRRQFQMMRPEGYAKSKRQIDGDDLDIDAVVRYMVDIKAGVDPDERIYIKTLKSRRDVAVGFLIDISTSTAGSKLETEKKALILMSEALNELGDNFGIYAFYSGYSGTQFYVLKDIDEEYNHQVKMNISSLECGSANRDGAAIRHATRKLLNAREKSKLLIVLSDGQPSILPEYSGDYAYQDVRMSLMEAKQKGVGTFCVTVDYWAHDYMDKMYHGSNWIRIKELDDLPVGLPNIYRRLTR